MNEIDTIAKELVAEIAHAKTITTTTDIADVFMSAEQIIGTLAYLIGPIQDMEQEYRKLALKRDEESQSQADARAKASDEYKRWKKFERLYDLAHEQVMMLKKFKDDIAMERQRI